MDYSEVSTILKRIPMLGNLSSANQKILAFTIQQQTYEDGDIIFNAGDPATDIFVIIEGTVEQVLVNTDGNAHAGTIGKHKLFGEMAIIQHVPRLVTTYAKGQVQVLRIEGDMFLQMVTNCPESALSVMKELANKISILVDAHKDHNV